MASKKYYKPVVKEHRKKLMQANLMPHVLQPEIVKHRQESSHYSSRGNPKEAFFSKQEAIDHVRFTDVSGKPILKYYASHDRKVIIYQCKDCKLWHWSTMFQKTRTPVGVEVVRD